MFMLGDYDQMPHANYQMLDIAAFVSKSQG